MSGLAITPVFLLVLYSPINAVPTRPNGEVGSELLSREANHSSSQWKSTVVNASNESPNEKCQAENYSFRTPILDDVLESRLTRYRALKNKTYNWAIYGFGVSNIMSYTAHFCKDEGRNGAIEVISVGSGDGTVDNGIIEAYHDHFGEKLSITLVDKDPKFEVDYRTVSELIEKRPNVVGNCVLLIFWPQGEFHNEGYDIDAVGELQPLAALVLYETTGLSGSQRFQTFVGDKSRTDYQWRWAHFKNESSGLENYAVEEVAYQRVNGRAGDINRIVNVTWITEPGLRILSLRLVKLKRIKDRERIKRSRRGRRKEIVETLASNNSSTTNFQQTVV